MRNHRNGEVSTGLITGMFFFGPYLEHKTMRKETIHGKTVGVSVKHSLNKWDIVHGGLCLYSIDYTISRFSEALRSLNFSISLVDYGAHPRKQSFLGLFIFKQRLQNSVLSSVKTCRIQLHQSHYNSPTVAWSPNTATSLSVWCRKNTDLTDISFCHH